MEISERIKLAFLDNLIWFIAAGLYAFFAALRPTGFLTWGNVEFILYTSSTIGLLVLAEALVLITGNLDLSLAQNAGFSAMVGGFVVGVMFPGLPGWIGLLIVISVGAAIGAFNGILIGKLGYNAFLATLVSYLIFQWATFWLRRGVITGLPASFFAPGSNTLGGVHVAIFIFVTIAIILHVVLRHTKLGLRIYATGGNSDTTEMMGIKTGNVLLYVFIIAGALAGLAGTLYIGYVGAVTSTLASGKIFSAFAGAIIGGISLKGGRGSLLGAMGGIIMLGILEAGLTMFAVGPAVRGVLNGVVLGVAIGLNMTISKLRDRILMPS